MKRFLILIFFFITVFGLNACVTQAEATPTAEIPIVTSPIVIPDTPTPEFTCSQINVVPTSTPNSASLFPPVSDADFSIGPADAPVTLVEYCDFQSQGCAAMANIVGSHLF